MKTFSSTPLMPQIRHDTPGAVFLPAEDRGLPDRIKAFFRGFAGCIEGSSHSSKKLLNSSLGNFSSITMPNGPWVYTVVPWED
jgi:hypothetical protein